MKTQPSKKFTKHKRKAKILIAKLIQQLKVCTIDSKGPRQIFVSQSLRKAEYIQECLDTLEDFVSDYEEHIKE